MFNCCAWKDIVPSTLSKFDNMMTMVHTNFRLWKGLKYMLCACPNQCGCRWLPSAMLVFLFIVIDFIQAVCSLFFIVICLLSGTLYSQLYGIWYDYLSFVGNWSYCQAYIALFHIYSKSHKHHFRSPIICVKRTKAIHFPLCYFNSGFKI